MNTMSDLDDNDLIEMTGIQDQDTIDISLTNEISDNDNNDIIEPSSRPTVLFDSSDRSPTSSEEGQSLLRYQILCKHIIVYICTCIILLYFILIEVIH